MFNIIVVCTGNTCRSPMAEALLKEKVTKAGFEGKINVSSAGLAAGASCPASRGAYTVMKGWGLDLDSHRSQQLTPQNIITADLILTMTQGHKEAILAFLPQGRHKIFTLPEYAGVPGDVADPFGGDTGTYAKCADQIAGLVDKVWEKIVVLAGKVV